MFQAVDVSLHSVIIDTLFAAFSFKKDKKIVLL